MAEGRMNRWLGIGVGAVLASGITLAVSRQTMAQRAEAPDQETVTLGQRAALVQAGGQGGFGGAPGQPGLGGRQPGGLGGFGGGAGQPGGPPPGGFGGWMPMQGPAGGPQLTATATHVYVLRGNTLFSFDAKTLKPAGQAELPPPEPVRAPPPPGE